MARPVTLFTGQWADMTLETICQKASQWGYDGIELPCWGDHFNVQQALRDDGYCQQRRELLDRCGLKCWAISNHLVGQLVLDVLDARTDDWVPPALRGNSDKKRDWAIQEMKDTARAAKKMGVKVVNGFTGSSIWHLLYSFPPNDFAVVEGGYRDFAERFGPIVDAFDTEGVRFGLEVHPTEIAFDISSAERALDALRGRASFGFNYDASHFGYQGVDYIAFIERLGDRIYHAHMKDVWWSAKPTPSGVFGGHLNFGHPDRHWDFRSIGRGRIDFEEIIRALNRIGYQGPLSIEWEDSGMDRDWGAPDALAFVRRVDFAPSELAFDAAMQATGR